jgi:hypothetical protein
MKVLLWLMMIQLGVLASATGSPLAGTWRGSINNLPAVTLNISESRGKVMGTILFYFLHRSTESGPWEVDKTHSKSLPLLDPKFDGTTLKFKVSHKEAHPPQTLNDPPSSFQMRLTGKGLAELENLTERQGPPLKMIRDAK